MASEGKALCMLLAVIVVIAALMNTELNKNELIVHDW